MLPYDAAARGSAAAKKGVEARWDVALECKHEKPSGYARCSSYLQDLARHRIKATGCGCATSASATHTRRVGSSRVYAEPLEWEEVEPTMCGVCKRRRAALHRADERAKCRRCRCVLSEPRKVAVSGKAAESDIVGAGLWSRACARVKQNPGFDNREWAAVIAATAVDV